MTRVERIFSVTVFPAVLGGSIAIGLYLVETEFPPAESIGLLVFAAGLVSKVTTRQWDGLGEVGDAAANFELVTEGGEDDIVAGGGD